jgi:hypothetical protein
VVQPGVYNIKLQRRADFSLQLQFKDSTGAAINLTGWTAAAQIWDAKRSTKYADFAVAYSNRTNGQIEISLTAAQTTAFTSELHYDVLLTNPSGFKEYYLEGSVSVSEGYTS